MSRGAARNVALAAGHVRQRRTDRVDGALQIDARVRNDEVDAALVQ